MNPMQAKIHRTQSILLSLTPILALLGCGGGSTLNVQNPPPPQTQAVAIQFQPAPPPTVVLNSTANLTAVVSNDPTNAGVDWSLLCSSGSNCGTLLPLHTASGTAATYTPPSTISGNNQTFTVEAFASADHTKNVVTGIAVTGFAGVLKGSYVFQTQGIDGNGVFQFAGVVMLDGNGGITGGEQTHSDAVVSVTDMISSGSYYVGPDGRGNITINTADQNIGQQGVENLSVVVLSSSQAFLTTLDNPNLPPSNETSSGTMDLQTSTTAPQRGYAFAMSGIDLSFQPMTMGGVLNIDSPGGISGNGSITDQDDAGTVFPSAAVSGSVSTPDSFGAVTFNLTTAFAAITIQLTGYIVDSQHIKLIESDNNGSGSGFGITAGRAIGQGTATGSFTTNKSVAGKYAFGILGEDLSAISTSLASVGQFTADASGNLTGGYNDEFLQGFAVEIADSLTGSYTLDASGTGRVDSTINYTTNGPGPELIFYLTGNGNPALVLDADASIGSVGAGISYVQGAPPFSFNGKYGLYLAQGVFGSENDATGQFIANETSQVLSGVIDTNLQWSPQPDSALSGTFKSITNSGRFNGTLTNTFFPSPSASPNTLAVRFYLIDSQHGFFIETDSLTSGDLSFGYFAGRSPVCPACP